MAMKEKRSKEDVHIIRHRLFFTSTDSISGTNYSTTAIGAHVAKGLQASPTGVGTCRPRSQDIELSIFPFGFEDLVF